MLTTLLVHASSVEDQTVYRVGVEDIDYFPLFTQAGTIPDQGYLIELMKLFSKHKGYQFEFVRLPIARFPDWYNNNDIDFRIPDNPLWTQPPNDLMFSDGLLNLDTVIVTLEDKQENELVTFKTIGTIQGFTPSPYWQKQLDRHRIKFVYENSMKVLIQLLVNGIVDGLDANLTVAQHYAQQLGHSPQRFVMANSSPVEHFEYHLSTIEHPKVIEQFNQFLEDNPSLIQGLKSRYQLQD